MENREESPTKQAIIDYIVEWQQKPVRPTLGVNQITTTVLMEITGFGYDWAKIRLREMWAAGLCERRKVFLRQGSVFVYTFPDELPTFSSSPNVGEVE